MAYNCRDQDSRARADLLAGPPSLVPLTAGTIGWGNPLEPMEGTRRAHGLCPSNPPPDPILFVPTW